LPTIKSRSRIIDVVKPSKSEIKSYYSDKNDTEIDQNYILADGAPRLIDILFNNDDHDIKKDINLAKEIISSDKIHKMSFINSLSKNRKDALKMINLIKQMSKLGSLSDNANQASMWQNILDKSIRAEEKINSNSNLKLTLLDLFINI
jgi:hypothetical protein